jgi:N-methylhydantoinase A
VAVRAPVAGESVAGMALSGQASGGGAVKGVRPAYFPEHRGFAETTVYDRARLAPGDEIRGPAVVEEEGSTLVIGPGGTARVAATGNIVVTLA